MGEGMPSAVRALLCSDLPQTAQCLRRIVGASAAMRVVGVARSRSEALELMAECPDVLVVDARLDSRVGHAFLDKVAGPELPVLRVVEPGQEASARGEIRPKDRERVSVVGRDVVERGEASTDAVVRTRLCLLAARGHRSEVGAAPKARKAEAHAELQRLVEEAYDAVVLLGSAGTPHLLPRLLPASRVGAAPLVVAVHHNPRFSDDFFDWVGELSGRRPLRYDTDAVLVARPEALFAAAAVQRLGWDPGELGPDLGGVLLTLAARSLRLLVCVASGMEDPVTAGLAAVVRHGGHVAALAARHCAQDGLVRAAQAAGAVDAEVDVDGMAWLIRCARARPS